MAFDVWRMVTQPKIGRRRKAAPKPAAETRWFVRRRGKSFYYFLFPKEPGDEAKLTSIVPELARHGEHLKPEPAKLRLILRFRKIAGKRMQYFLVSKGSPSALRLDVLSKIKVKAEGLRDVTKLARRKLQKEYLKLREKYKKELKVRLLAQKKAELEDWQTAFLKVLATPMERDIPLFDETSLVAYKRIKIPQIPYSEEDKIVLRAYRYRLFGEYMVKRNLFCAQCPWLIPEHEPEVAVKGRHGRCFLLSGRGGRRGTKETIAMERPPGALCYFEMPDYHKKVLSLVLRKKILSLRLRMLRKLYPLTVQKLLPYRKLLFKKKLSDEARKKRKLLIETISKHVKKSEGVAARVKRVFATKKKYLRLEKESRKILNQIEALIEDFTNKAGLFSRSEILLSDSPGKEGLVALKRLALILTQHLPWVRPMTGLPESIKTYLVKTKKFLSRIRTRLRYLEEKSFGEHPPKRLLRLADKIMGPLYKVFEKGRKVQTFKFILAKRKPILSKGVRALGLAALRQKEADELVEQVRKERFELEKKYAGALRRLGFPLLPSPEKEPKWNAMGLPEIYATIRKRPGWLVRPVRKKLAKLVRSHLSYDRYLRQFKFEYYMDISTREGRTIKLEDMNLAEKKEKLRVLTEARAVLKEYRKHLEESLDVCPICKQLIEPGRPHVH